MQASRSKNHQIFMKFCTAANFELGERHMIKNEKVALDRFRVRQNLFLVFLCRRKLCPVGLMSPAIIGIFSSHDY